MGFFQIFWSLNNRRPALVSSDGIVPSLIWREKSILLSIPVGSPPFLPENLTRICGYEAKWAPHSPYARLRSVQAELPGETEKSMVEACLELYERLGCRDYARFDWRLDAMGNPKLLEVNPNPGWCWDGHLAKMAAFAGTSYPEMLKMILYAVEQRLGLESVGVPNEEALTALPGNGLH